MKKKYVAPTCKTHQVRPSTIIAGSFTSSSVRNGGDDSGNAFGEARGRNDNENTSYIDW